MGSRVPVEHYDLRAASSFVGASSLHDLNTVDDIGGVGRDAATEDSLDNDDDSAAVECIHDSYRASLPIHGVGAEDDRSGLEEVGPSRSSYDVLTIEGDLFVYLFCDQFCGAVRKDLDVAF